MIYLKQKKTLMKKISIYIFTALLGESMKYSNFFLLLIVHYNIDSLRVRVFFNSVENSFFPIP